LHRALLRFRFRLIEQEDGESRKSDKEGVDLQQHFPSVGALHVTGLAYQKIARRFLLITVDLGQTRTSLGVRVVCHTRVCFCIFQFSYFSNFLIFNIYRIKNWRPYARTPFSGLIC